MFGKSSPAGRLDQTWYPKEFGDGVSIFDMNLRPGPSEWPRPDCPLRPASKCPRSVNPGVTHKYYTGKTVFPFGYGLSYSKFQYEIVSAPSRSISLAPLHDIMSKHASSNRTFVDKAMLDAQAPLAAYSVNVTNVGDFDADDAVLGFVVPPGAGKDGVPLQELFGFERIHVKKGETRTVWLYPEALVFSQVDSRGRRYVDSGSYKFRFGVR